MNDTWWAFVAQIDRHELLLEVPGGTADRRMRSEHAARVDAFYGPRHGLVVVPARKQPSELDKQLAAYAAAKRKKAAA